MRLVINSIGEADKSSASFSQTVVKYPEFAVVGNVYRKKSNSKTQCAVDECMYVES
jgi:hypothetical protein